jgi:predicted 3-demethylubiquinone-9 3-methyltransferase (glyoxalase superfamily)
MSAFENYPRITPFLWFDSNAEEAVDFYLTVFKNSRKIDVVNNSPDHPNLPAKVLTISFELDGLKFTALNGGPAFRFTEAVSFLIRCDTQQEVDDYWSKLTSGGAEIQCGWLKDKFGVVWQVVPAPSRPHQKPKGHAGHDEDEKTRHRRTRTCRAVLIRTERHTIVRRIFFKDLPASRKPDTSVSGHSMRK